MKLRLKFGGQRKTVHIDDSGTFQDLITAIGEVFNVTSNALRESQVSLNGRDVIEASSNTSLSDLCIVHGDLVHVLLPVDKPAVGTSSPDNEDNQTKYEPPTSKENGTLSVSKSTPSPVHIPDSGATYSASQTPGLDTVSISNTESSTEAMECCWTDDNEAIQDGKVNQYLHEPMLVCDSTYDSVPSALQTVYAEAGVATINEAVCVLLHVLMSESGFSCGTQRRGVEREHVSCPMMPSDWKAQKTHRLTYNHESCPAVTFTLVCVPMGKVLVVHGTATGVTLEQKCQFKFQPSDYIIKIDAHAAETFKNLSKFSRLFKDKVAYPIIQLCRQALGHPNTIGLLGLMEEIKVLICSHLDAKSLCRISQVTHEFHRIAMQPKLWRRLYLRNFGRRTNNALSQDWCKLYKEKYILRRDMRARMHQARCVVPPRFLPPPFAGPGDPFPFNPGFIGGDYDRYPAIPGIPGGVGPAVPRPRLGPFGPVPHQFFPGRGGGLWGFGRGGGRGGGFGGFFI